MKCSVVQSGIIVLVWVHHKTLISPQPKMIIFTKPINKVDVSVKEESRRVLPCFPHILHSLYFCRLYCTKKALLPQQHWTIWFEIPCWDKRRCYLKGFFLQSKATRCRKCCKQAKIWSSVLWLFLKKILNHCLPVGRKYVCLPSFITVILHSPSSSPWWRW